MVRALMLSRSLRMTQSQENSNSVDLGMFCGEISKLPLCDCNPSCVDFRQYCHLEELTKYSREDAEIHYLARRIH